MGQLRFGENNMHGCEIMLKDVADSKRINTNIKASVAGELGQRINANPPATPAGPAPTSGSTFTGGAGSDQGFSSPQSMGVNNFNAQATSMQGVRPQTGEGTTLSAASGGADTKLPLEILDATIISSLFWPPFQVPKSSTFCEQGSQRMVNSDGYMLP